MAQKRPSESWSPSLTPSSKRLRPLSTPGIYRPIYSSAPPTTSAFDTFPESEFTSWIDSIKARARSALRENAEMDESFKRARRNEEENRIRNLKARERVSNFMLAQAKEQETLGAAVSQAGTGDLETAEVGGPEYTDSEPSVSPEEEEVEEEEEGGQSEYEEEPTFAHHSPAKPLPFQTLTKPGHTFTSINSLEDGEDDEDDEEALEEASMDSDGHAYAEQGEANPAPFFMDEDEDEGGERSSDEGEKYSREETASVEEDAYYREEDEDEQQLPIGSFDSDPVEILSSEGTDHGDEDDEDSADDNVLDEEAYQESLEQQDEDDFESEDVGAFETEASAIEDVQAELLADSEQSDVDTDAHAPEAFADGDSTAVYDHTAGRDWLASGSQPNDAVVSYDDEKEGIDIQDVHASTDSAALQSSMSHEIPLVKERRRDNDTPSDALTDEEIEDERYHLWKEQITTVEGLESIAEEQEDMPPEVEPVILQSQDLGPATLHQSSPQQHTHPYAHRHHEHDHHGNTLESTTEDLHPEVLPPTSGHEIEDETERNFRVVADGQDNIRSIGERINEFDQPMTMDEQEALQPEVEFLETLDEQVSPPSPSPDEANDSSNDVDYEHKKLAVDHEASDVANENAGETDGMSNGVGHTTESPSKFAVVVDQPTRDTAGTEDAAPADSIAKESNLVHILRDGLEYVDEFDTDHHYSPQLKLSGEGPRRRRSRTPPK